MQFTIGDKVYTADDPNHIGTVERIDTNRTPLQFWVRWHKGMATWEWETDLRKLEKPNKSTNVDDFPFNEVVAKAIELNKFGFLVFQKFTCAGCGQRLTIAEPNTFHTTGSCDKCPALTDIEKQGCNYLLMR